MGTMCMLLHNEDSHLKLVFWALQSECGGSSSLPFWVRFNSHYEEMIASVQRSSLLPHSPSSLFIEASPASRGHAAADPSGDAAITTHSLLCRYAVYMCVYVC